MVSKVLGILGVQGAWLTASHTYSYMYKYSNHLCYYGNYKD